MATTPITGQQNSVGSIIGAGGISQLKASSGWLLGLGVLFIVLGIVGLGMTFALTLTSAMFFGVLLLIGGVAQLVDLKQRGQWKGVGWHLGIAVLYLAAGGIVLANPLLATVLITGILAVSLVMIGIVRILIAVTHREAKAWTALFVAGLVSLVLGGMILSQWPASGLWVIGLFVAIELLMHGLALVTLAMTVRAAT